MQINKTFQSIQTFVKSFSSPSVTSSDDGIAVAPFLDEIGDLSSIECSQPILQSLAFIAGYTVHKFLKRSQECHVCTDTLTYDKEFIFDVESHSEFKLLQLTDRGGLKYPSEHVLTSIITLWNAIEANNQLLTLLVDGPSRRLLVELTLIYMENDDDIDIWKANCINCDVYRWSILSKLIFTAANCFLANKIKNYNSSVLQIGIDKRKLKNFS